MDTRAAVVAATLVASIAVTVSFITSSSVVARAYVERTEAEKRRETTLEVTGSAKERIVSDLALWSIKVVGEAPTQVDAYARLESASAGVRAFLQERGFPAGEVSPGAIETETRFKLDAKGKPTHDIEAFILVRWFSVRSAEPSRIEAAAGEVTALLKTGARVESGTPRYVYTKLAELKIRMMGAATANAKLRAETIATGSGCRLGVVIDAGAGPLQITPPWSTEVSSGGINDTSTIEKDVTSVVHLSFAIRRD